MNGDPIPGQSGTEGEKRNGEKEYRARQYFQEGASSLEVLRTGIQREQLIDAERTFIAGFEDMSLHRDGTVSEWRLDDAISLVADRSAAMAYDFNTLSGLGYLDPASYNPETTEANFAYPGYCYTTITEIRPVIRGANLAPDGKTVISQIVENVPTQVFLTGKDEQREELSEILKDDIQPEMTSRKDLVQMTRWLWNQTENLDDLVKYYYMGSQTNVAIDALCNAGGRKYVSKDIKIGQEAHRYDGLLVTEGGAEYREGHEFGDAMSVALQCFEIAAVSENVDELKNLLMKPGAKFLFKVSDQEIADIFLKPEERQNRPLNPILVKWVGEPHKWETTINDSKVNVKKEKESRGLLTNKGNILVESSWNDAEEIFKQIERFIGGGKEAPILAAKDARDARFIAWELVRLTGMASELGKQLYRKICVDGIERVIYCHDLGGITSCDRVKVLQPNVFRNVYEYIKPEKRNEGPTGSLGSYDEEKETFNNQYPDRFCVQYFKYWNSTFELTNEHDAFGKYIGPTAKRTFQEMRWGYKQEEETDFSTGEKIILPAERAYRLGELPWKVLGPKAFNNAALGPYIAGRENIGLFSYMKRDDWELKEVEKFSLARNMANWLGIAMSAQVVFDGKFRNVYKGEYESKLSDEEKTKKKGEKLALDKKVKDGIREYKKKFVKAWWNGLRSLPQWREWRAQSDKLDSVNNPNLMFPLKRIKYMLGRVEILTPDEADKLSEEFYYPLKEDAFKGF